MKALDEYFLMVVFTLLLKRVHVFAIFMFNLAEKDGSERDKVHFFNLFLVIIQVLILYCHNPIQTLMTPHCLGWLSYLLLFRKFEVFKECL